MRFLFLAPLAAVALQAAEATPTFHRDILPILQQHCQSCHRPGEAAPMPLLTYAQVRPYAVAIRESVRLKKMPPWGADPAHGQFANDPSLTAKQVNTLSAWATAHAPEGSPQDAPKPVAFVEGWNIGRPDVVYEMPREHAIPAQGVVEYTYFVLPANLNEDRWVSGFEVRPGNRALVHHVIAYVREPGSKWLADAKPGEPYVPPARTDPKTGRVSRDTSGQREFLVGYAPGVPGLTLRPGQAKLIKAGSDIVFEMHYTPNGTANTDRSKVGLVFAKQAPTERVFTVGAANGKFVIPPGAAAHPVDSTLTFYGNAKIISYLPHMHLRGKTFRYDLVSPTGERRTLLNVPRYDFNWQHVYELAEPLAVTPGTTIECAATFDNSPNNPHNPDPKSEVRWGDQSWEEMMIGFMEVAIDVNKSPADLLRKPKAPAAAPSGE